MREIKRRLLRKSQPRGAIAGGGGRAGGVCARMPVRVERATLFSRPLPAEAPRSASSNRMENAVAESILSSCKAVDEHAKLVHMTKDAEGHTHVRVRAGDVHSVESLRRELEAALPLAACDVTESWLDGSLEAELTIFSPSVERRRARALVTRSKWISRLIGIAWLLIFVGVSELVAALRAVLVAKDEL